MKSRVPLVETAPPKPPRTFDTTVSAHKEFPLRRGDTLLVRNAKGRVIERIDVGDHLYSLEKSVVLEAELTRFDR